jgi:hypothetical protein
VARVRNYNEGQSFTATFKFFDASNFPSSPITARYRIDCLSSGQEVRGWTELTPAQSIDIAVTPSDNAIKDSRNSVERKQIVVQSNYGTESQSVQDSEWEVKNLQGVR